MGFYGSSRIWYLKQFDAYGTAHERTAFDCDTVEGWVSQQLTHSGRYRSWMSYIREVGRWLQARGRGEFPIDQVGGVWALALPGQASPAQLGLGDQTRFGHQLGDRVVRDLPALLAPPVTDARAAVGEGAPMLD